MIAKSNSPRPIMFGPNDRLFGIYHAAQGFQRQHGLVIAGPLLNEGMRAHSVLRRIALKAAKAGYDVLRFDYSGMGNSLGETNEFNVADWSQDLESAATTIGRLADAEAVSVFAVRFSAALALQLCANRSFERIVAWDPLIDGESWLESLDRAHAAHLQRYDADSLVNVCHGHLVNESLRQDVQAFAAGDKNPKQMISILSSDVMCDSRELDDLSEILSVSSEADWETRRSYVLQAHDVVESATKVLR